MFLVFGGVGLFLRMFSVVVSCEKVHKRAEEHKEERPVLRNEWPLEEEAQTDDSSCDEQEERET